MMDWFTRTAVRMPLLLAAYFAAHVALRVGLSPSLDFDESEQIFLTQFMAAGYNNQPPLYTWIQMGLQELFGCTILSLSIQKNLFLLGTYLCVLAGVKKATGDLRVAVIAALGIFTIPQVAWESQRDLSHTVAAMFSASLLFFAIVGLTQSTGSHAKLGWYALIGIAVGTGLQFKYNYAIVVISFLLAMAAVREYRHLILNWRVMIAVALAALIVAPNVWWVLNHPQAAIGATVSKLSANSSEVWLDSVSTGLSALSVTLVACCGITLWMFWFLFIPKQATPNIPQSLRRKGMEHLSLMLEYFLMIALGMLFLMVLSGMATDFKNRWVQPIVFLLPVFLALRFGYHVMRRPRSQELGFVLTVGMMAVILLATYGRTQTGRLGGKYSRLNSPFAEAARQLRTLGGEPDVIVAADMRVAGNMRLLFPESRVISLDALALTPVDTRPSEDDNVWVLAADPMSEEQREQMAKLAGKLVGSSSLTSDPWQTLTVPYLYGADGDSQMFSYFQIAANSGPDAVVAQNPTDRSDQTDRTDQSDL